MRLKNIFQQDKKILNVYFTAGYPSLNDTIPVMQALAKNGADIIEIGMPYSDPLADGPVIQSSSSKALENGMTIELLFEQLSDFRKTPELENVGVVLMGYMNPVLQYGFERFCKEAAAVGIDGLILPDLPAFEFDNLYATTIRKEKLDFIFLITPETSEERVRALDELSTGFIYAVSSSATTGTATDSKAVEAYLERLRRYQLKNPIMVGFGIKDKSSFDAAAKYTSGAIIGTAFIKALGEGRPIEETVASFLNKVIK